MRSATALALTVAFASTGAEALAAGPPPEWAANAGAWPAHSYDLANTRATTQTPIDSRTVARLKAKWRFAFGAATSQMTTRCL